MIEFLQNLFGNGNQQIPVSLQNPDPENPNSPNYRQNVYERQIAPWMRAGMAAPNTALSFESAAPAPIPVSPEVQQANQQQEMLKRYAMANMGRMGGQPGLVPMESRDAYMDPLRYKLESTPFSLPGYTPSRTLPMEEIKKDEPISRDALDEAMFSDNEVPELYKLMMTDFALNLGNPQAAPMTREAAGYVPTGIETLVPGASTMGIDFTNTIMNPARKRLGSLLGL